MEEQVGPLTICSVVSAEICAMTRRAAELAENALRQEGLGCPPVPYAVLVLGSAGRGESQLAADQDNAIVYAEGAEGGPEDRYFEELGKRMSETLDAAGVPLCKGGVMARNRAWRKSVADWHATIDRWMSGSRPSHLLNVDIFFDAVPVHGDARLADNVWGHAYDRAHAAIGFQNLLIEAARQRDSPFTLFGRFRLDEKGRIVDGDQIMAVIAESWYRSGKLARPGVVATVMSNLGLERYLAGLGLKLERTPVGDRYVVEHMRRDGHNVGGEQSGHIVLSDYTTTGDGLVAALQVLAVVVGSGQPVSEACKRFEAVPQLLQNVRYADGAPLEHAMVKSAIDSGRVRLGENGRLLVRPSGTEPVIRVMAEGDDEGLVRQVVGDIAEAVRSVAREAVEA